MYAWTHLPRWVRAGSALIMLGIGLYLLLNGVIWYWSWAAGLLLLFFSFVEPIGPSPWKQRGTGATTPLPPVPRLDGTSATETPEEVLARIRATRGDNLAQLRTPRPASRKPKPLLWLVLGVATTIFFALGMLGYFR